MASVKFNKKKFEKEIGKLTESFQNKIALFGTTVESVGDKEIELDITPNRPDLLSYGNFKREFLTFLGKRKGLKEYKLNKLEKNHKVKIDSSVKEVRPLTVCSIVKNLKLDNEKIKEIIDLQEKLHSTLGRKRGKFAIGIYPLEKIKLPITYKAIEPFKIKFTPLESSREMSGLEVLQKHPAGKDYAHLLKCKANFPIFIDADNKILSMPPIINSEHTGRVDLKTKEVFVEVSGFEEEILNKTLNMIITTLSEMGGKIYPMKVWYSSAYPKSKNSRTKITPNFKTEKMKVSVEKINKLLGLDLKEKDLKPLFQKMGHNYEKGFVEIPSWRVDILGEVDLIEEVAIAYGYDKFESVIPNISCIGSEQSKEIIKRKISEILIGLGLLEISNYHLTKKQNQFTKMGINEKQEKGFIEVEESKTENNILRKDLSHYLMKIFSENIDREYPHRIFEIGRVFESKETEELIESERLSIGLSPGNFTELKQILEYLEKTLDLKFEIEEQEKSNGYFIEGRSVNILFNKKIIGNLGEIHPKILKNWKCKMPIVLLEINLETIFEKYK
ncbi:MAG: phenylalanine--tRNA ligase subunit beta [Nanoarchaeota archaeon]|nr:phenylalanine--tRNA ligase subunit beta [Nanoarchaeota archaeon]